MLAAWAGVCDAAMIRKNGTSEEESLEAGGRVSGRLAHPQMKVDGFTSGHL